MQVALKKQRHLLRLIVAVLLGCVVFPSFAQDFKLTGVVRGADDNMPLIGATVRVQSGAVTVTDADGAFSVNVRKGQTVTFSYIGYTTQSIKISDRSKVEIYLKEDSKTLDEVVVVGYGTMKRSDLTGSVVSVSAEDIKKTVATSLDQALQGRAAGVQVTQNSGAPGGGISVSIRGTNSLNGNEPLYVVDGVPLSGQADGNSNALSAINPSDIVSMEVLKDASATAIYGSRASNGVIMITTRRGEAGKTKLSYEGYYGIQNIPDRLDVMDLRQFATYRNLRAEVMGFGATKEFADVSILGKGTDWQDEIFRTAHMHNHQLTVSGGNDWGKYAIGLGYLGQDGIAIGSDFERLSGRINIDTNITKWLSFGVSASLSRTKQTNTIDNGNIIRTALDQHPNVPVRNPDGSYGYQTEDNNFGTFYANPVADALLREDYNRGTDFYGNLFADFKIINGLNLRVEYGGGFNYSNHYYYRPTYDYGFFIQDSESSRSASNGKNYFFKTFLTYDKHIRNHSFNVMIGHESSENEYEYLSGSRKNYFLNSVHELVAGDALTAKNNSSRGSGSMESYFGRANYNFADRYLLTFTLRADGSSNFGKANRWGWFPSAAFGWRISQEKFMKNVEPVNNLKLRLGWGIVGNQNAGAYAYGTTMASSATIWGAGFYAGNYSNDKLKWEETKSYNVGLDLTMFNNRLEFIIDAYLKKTDNLLMQASLPDYVTSIISSPWVNAGAIENKGFEWTLNTVNISTRDFSWRTGFTFSLNRNKVTKLYTKTSSITGKIGADTYTNTVVGQPVGQFYGYNVIGMFKEADDFYVKDKNGDFMLDDNFNRILVAIPEGKTIKENEIWYGDYIFEDVNKDGVINESDRKFIGNPEPKFTYGFNTTLTYKDFDFNLSLVGVHGNKVFNYLRQVYTDPMRNSNLLMETTRLANVGLIDPDGGHTFENMHVINSDARICRIALDNSNNNNRMSSYFVEDGSYLRVKNISLGYTFPKQLIKRASIENLRLYFNVQNPFTFTRYKGFDPEIGAYNYNVLTRGIDYARYPSQVIYTFGLNVSL